ncbi:hypothetical protein [Conexibacter sp. SYSU D00693]|uniref:hypothetical protein n=1 Tax=Conexibacter sp. SYSU D00693 TaxID=2812560 RepID=UPI00196AB455|nr:hypothetical protein [Conexibacter sp. SYSU D00693]
MHDVDPLIALAHEGDGGPCDTVYLGFGLAAHGGLTTGELPLDALAMLVVAERQRRLRGAQRILHLVADRHALVNAFATRREVARAADALVDQLEALAPALGLQAYDVVRASQLTAPEYRRLVADAGQRAPDPYGARQAADVEWMRRAHGAAVKVGWTLSARPDGVARRDEVAFDALHRQLFGPGLATVYTGPGRSLDPDRPRCSPYVLLAGQRRLTLASGAGSVAEHCASSRMRRHLRPIAERVLQQLGVVAVADTPLQDRLELLLALLRGDARPDAPLAQPAVAA